MFESNDEAHKDMIQYFNFDSNLSENKDTFFETHYEDAKIECEDFITIYETFLDFIFILDLNY